MAPFGCWYWELHIDIGLNINIMGYWYWVWMSIFLFGCVRYSELDKILSLNIKCCLDVIKAVFRDIDHCTVIFMTKCAKQPHIMVQTTARQIRKILQYFNNNIISNSMHNPSWTTIFNEVSNKQHTMSHTQYDKFLHSNHKWQALKATSTAILSSSFYHISSTSMTQVI